MANVTDMSWNSILRKYIKIGMRINYRIRNLLITVIRQISMLNFSIICIILMVMAINPTLLMDLTKNIWGVTDETHAHGAVLMIISTIICGIMIIVLLRQYLLRLLFSYRGWMNITPSKKPQKRILIWGSLVRLFSDKHPSLYSFQSSLPRLAVPPLKDTLSKLFESMSPVCDDEEFALIKKQAKEFETTIGSKVQRMLILKSWVMPNYVSDWWEKYVYLKCRSPLPNSSNYYGIDRSYWVPTHRQASRAAVVTVMFLKFKKLIDSETLPPIVLQKVVPLCMQQYKKVFSTTRIPLKDIDEVVHYPRKYSKHIIVICKGIHYRVDVYDSNNQIISAKDLEKRIEWIMEDAEKHDSIISDEEKSVSALTTLERNEWARIRKEYLSFGINNLSRDVIERSIFVVSLIDQSPDSLTDVGKWSLHGDGKNIWFDKSINILIFANGKCGINCEHTHAEALPNNHVTEYALRQELIERLYDDDGTCTPPLKGSKHTQMIPLPSRLSWEIDSELSQIIKHSQQLAIKNNNDIDIVVCDHNSWGKGEIKKCKISPDAFFQMAIQLAYYKDNRKFVQTYEPASMRLYLNGRTETVRSCTKEAVDFVMSMINDVPNDERIRLLKIAAAKHTQLYKDAMNGKGIDRHLFALFVASKGLGYESEFLQNVLSRKWTLSTSQTPYSLLTESIDSSYKPYFNKVSPGGGFGPVSDDGYGIFYLFPNDDRIFFHITSKKSCLKTDSNRFKDLINESLDDIKLIFQ